MEKDNQKSREIGKKEFNETVRVTFFLLLSFFNLNDIMILK